MSGNNQLTISLPANVKLLPVISDTAKQYFRSWSFPDTLCEMIAGSLEEGCDELIRVCREKDVDTPFQVCLDFQENVAVVQIIYNSGIPLHPHQTANYEVPSSMDDLDELDMATLWLHLIKKRMDRVFFKVDGPRQILQMMKYQREENQTRQFWIMGLAPKLKDGLKIDVKEGGKEGLIQDPVKGSLLKLDAGGLFIIPRLDGKKTFHEIYMEYIDEVGMISPQRLAMIFEQLEKHGMLEEKSSAGQKKGWKILLSKILNPMFSFSNADGMINKVYQYTFFFFKPFGVLLLLLIGLSGILPLLTHFARIRELLADPGDFYVREPWLIPLVYFFMLLTIIIHEFGHGLACKHFGGSISRMGIMFYLAMFMFFCDTSSSWNFRSKWQRVAVSLGGPLFTFAILGCLLNLFSLTAGTGSVWEIGLITLILMNVLGLILNFNPFIKMDAYYILMDLANIPNLRKRSFDFIGSKFFLRHLDSPEISNRERIIFWLYGVIGITVTVTFLLLPLGYYGWLLLFHGGNTGRIIFAVIAVFIILLRLSHQAFTALQSIRQREYKLT